MTGGHPFATDGSVEAARRALEVARSVEPRGRLILLLSGGASALMAAPAHGLTLAVKQQTARTLMTSGADITALNAVRKHLSAVKGGRLAAACRGQVITLAISDVVGDDLSVIGSGPGVADPSTWRDMREALHAFGGAEAHDPAVLALAEAGDAGRLAETPKPGDAAMARSRAHVIGGRREAMAGAAAEARRRGYETVQHEPPVVGEARDAAAAWWTTVAAPLVASGRPAAIVSSGETTVRVRGAGRGGRNQEFALALVERLAVAARRRGGVGRHRRHRRPDRRRRRIRRRDDAGPRRGPRPRRPRTPGSTATTATRTSRSSAISGSPARPGPTSATCKCC